MIFPDSLNILIYRDSRIPDMAILSVIQYTTRYDELAFRVLIDETDMRDFKISFT
jgi:hypothetical protein